MADPAAWMLEEETDTDRLRMALAEARADLQRHRAALLQLQGELMASRLEVSGARQETVQFQGLLRRVEEAQAASRDAEMTQLRAVIATLQAETVALRVGMDLLRASASWRISAPVRVAGRLMRHIHRAGSRLPQAIRRSRAHQTASVARPPQELTSPNDPNARVIFQAAPLAEHHFGGAEGVVTLDALYHLSRSL